MHKKPSYIRSLIRRIALALLAQADKPRQAGSLLREALKIVLDLAGLIWLTFAGFEINSVTGSIVAGFSCFILARHFSGASPKPDPTMRQ